jgi:hypothetical protein
MSSSGGRSGRKSFGGSLDGDWTLELGRGGRVGGAPKGDAL